MTGTRVYAVEREAQSAYQRSLNGGGLKMRKGYMVLGVLLYLIVGPVAGLCAGRTTMEWEMTTQLELQTAPLDVAASADGKWIFILTGGEILVYSIAEERIGQRIPIELGFDRMSYQDRQERLILTSHASKALRIIQLELVHDMAVGGLPFKGPEDARVTIAVFSDYQ